MSYPIKHMCGCEIERSNHPIGGYYMYGDKDGDPVVATDMCPQCGEVLCDTDCTTLDGEVLFINNQSEWSKERRRDRGWKENP
jgi:hypothetical protein